MGLRVVGDAAYAAIWTDKQVFPGLENFLLSFTPMIYEERRAPGCTFAVGGTSRAHTGQDGAAAPPAAAD